MTSTTELDNIVANHLQKHKLRYTSGRRSIVAALAAIGGPVTLPDLLAFSGEITQSSAYRNLSLMEEAGVVRRLVHEADHAYFEFAEEITEHHHHLICKACGTVEDFTLDDKLEQLLDSAFTKVVKDRDATTSSHRIDLFVECADCRTPAE